MKTIKIGLLIILALSVFGCNNYFHDLMPPDGNRILSFSADGQIGNAVIGDDAVTAIISIEADITSIIPDIKVSPKATLFPLTLEYLKLTFPGIDVFEAAVELHKSGNLKAYVEDLIRKHPDFKVPVLDKPIDFSGPVNYIVMSGQGNIRQYRIIIDIDSGLPHLLSFGFYKYDNPELINDAVTAINESGQTIQSEILYPAEMNYLSYQLIPVYEILGDRIEVDNEEIKSGVDVIQFTQGIGTKTKKITVWRDGMSAEFILTAVFSEDPDSIRSITDFRFNKTNNAGISANAVASIIKNDALGTINVQVFYSGAKPAFLTPRFISPGTVTVGGLTQVSGSNIQDFSSPIEYYVISRNNKFTRTYTVYVDFVDIASSSPVINSFKFLSIINQELTEDSQAVISDASGQIMAAVKYRGTNAPEILAAEFSATGIVTVNSAVQTSGFSSQNFYRQVKYTVTHPENPLLKRDYWVQVSFTRDTSSDTAITSFSFHPDENAGLNEVLTGKIDNNARKITIFAPIGSGVSARTMYPRFSSAGQVSVNSVPQSSGTSGQVFNAPVIYKVVSANGINSREYFVTVRELRSTIYVNSNASGEGDGSSWTNAFRLLEDACNAAAGFDNDIPKEIWIAKGTYKPSPTGDSSEYFLLTPNTSYLGGFAGWETNKSERNAAVNPVVISGDLGGGVYSRNLFGNFYSDNTAQIINGDAVFDNLTFINANASGNGDRKNGGAINAAYSSDKELRITNCIFESLRSSSGSGAAVFTQGGDVYISNSSLTDCSSVYFGGALHFNGTGNAEITNVSITSITGVAIFNEGNMLTISDSEIKDIMGACGIYSAGGMQADNIDLQNLERDGIDVWGGTLNLSNINVNNAKGRGVIFSSYSYRAVIENSIFNDCGVIIIRGSSLDVTDTKITNIKSGIGDGLWADVNGNIYIYNVTVENVLDGQGIYLSSTSGAINIINSSVKNTSGSGITISSAGSVEISNTEIEYTGGSGAIRNHGNNFRIINTNIQNAHHGVSSSKGIEIDGMELHNITGTGISVSGGAMNISDVNASNIGSSSVYFTSSAADRVVIENSNFDRCGGVFGDVYIESSSSIQITDMEITNVNNNVSNGLYAKSNGYVNIENIKIENVPNGRGMYIDTSGTVTISNANIKNTKTTDSGAGICLSGSGNALLSDVKIENTATTWYGGGIYRGWNASTNTMEIVRTTIENVEARESGGGISLFSGTLIIRDSVIKNANVVYSGGGIYFDPYPAGSLIIENSIFENCVSNASYGAISARLTDLTITHEIINTKFINCTARNEYKIFNNSDNSIIKGCEFIHDSNCAVPETPSVSHEVRFFDMAGIFEDCIFTNLRSNKGGRNFLFNRWGTYSASGLAGISNMAPAGGTLTLKNCTFNLASGSAGIMALYGGQRLSGSNSYMKADELTMEGSTINFLGGQTPVIWFSISPQGSDESGTFRFKQNNKFWSSATGEITINNAAQIANLTLGGIVLLENGAMPVLVP